MNYLSAHVARHVVSAVVLVIVVLIGLFAVISFADELGSAPDHYNILNLVLYVLLRVPGMIVTNAGFAILIGCLLGLGVLASQSELTVMRASGVSVMRIVWMVLKPMLAVVLLVSLMGEYVVPDIDRYASLVKSEKQEQEFIFNMIRGDNGLWMRQENDFLHFNHVSANGDITGFARFVFDDHGELQYAQYASRAKHSTDAARPGWSLKKIRMTRFSENAVSTELQAGDDHWSSELEPGLLSVVASEPGSMSLRELRYYISYLAGQGQDSRIFELVFWQKAMQPLAMIGLVLVAISFIFGPLRDTTMGYRLFTGVMLGILFRFSQDLLGPTSMVYGFTPLLAVMAPIIVCWLLGVFLLLRTR
ncbi:MAG TPA: LPS export ABC transporter permease LptG [Pseudomonadales bacterium]|nr:LPS export ABC transporter permease LptG [Pseudomonadales bacterium]